MDSTGAAMITCLGADRETTWRAMQSFTALRDESAADEIWLVQHPPGAVEILTRKKNLRLIELPVAPAGAGELDFKRVRGGFLVQQRMSMRFDEAGWSVATKRQPTDAEMHDLRFAWRVAASVKSNAIVIAAGGRTLGIGAGQMSRVDSVRLAIEKAAATETDLSGGALASDAFFPFSDGPQLAVDAGVTAIIQPGGSKRDHEVVEAADAAGISMVFTHRRHFKH